MKHLNLLTFILLMTFQCLSNHPRSHHETIEIIVLPDSNLSTQNNLLIIEGSIGLIINSESHQFGDTIIVFNDNGKLIKPIITLDEKQKLSLKCIARDASYYQVMLEKREVGFIPLDEKGIVFQTWEEHLLSIFSVGFEESKNPLRKGPSENAESVYFDTDEFYHPDHIEGEWLKVKWGYGDSWEYAWLKWRDGEKLLIELFYFA